MERDQAPALVLLSLLKDTEANLTPMHTNVQPPTVRRAMTKYNKEPGLVGVARWARPP